MNDGSRPEAAPETAAKQSEGSVTASTVTLDRPRCLLCPICSCGFPCCRVDVEAAAP